MKKKIQRFFGLGPCWHSLNRYFIASFAFGSWAECNVCRTRMDIHQTSTIVKTSQKVLNKSIPERWRDYGSVWTLQT